MTRGDGSNYTLSMSIKVFVFEDHWMCREALVSVLSQENEIEVVGEAENVAAGLAMIQRVQPDVVLMDLRFRKSSYTEMEENLGIEATKKIRELLPEAKVIVYTDSPDENDVRNAVDAGVSGYLLKREVQDPDVIIKAIHRVYRGEAYMTPTITEKLLKVIRNRPRHPHYDLTKREIEILALIAEGRDNHDISERLHITTRTVANHVSSLLSKLGAKNRTEAVAIARKNGIL